MNILVYNRIKYQNNLNTLTRKNPGIDKIPLCCIVSSSNLGMVVMEDEGKSVTKMTKELYKAYGVKFTDFKIGDFVYEPASGVLYSVQTTTSD